MKKLILLLLSTTPLWASTDEINVLPEAELKNKLISTIKEVEVTSSLENSIEFRDCRDKAKFDPKNKPDQAAIDQAIKCFQDKLPKNDKDLASLSHNLGLQQYGLVASKGKQELTEYLSDQMYKSLTGVDRKEKDLKVLMENMKFGKMKMVDQRVFIDLYTTQLVKNSLFEVSRFCFENFRKSGSPEDVDFVTHWGDQLGKVSELALDEITDTGSKGLGTFSDYKSKDAIYKNILEGIGANNPNKIKTISNFFDSCSKKIVPLCNVFQEAVKKDSNTSVKKGANACLAKAKLQAARKAIADANKIKDDFNSHKDFQTSMTLLLNTQPQFYDPKKDTSIDELTNYSSADIMAGIGEDKKLQEKQEKCSQIENAKLPECEEFIVIDDSRAKAEHNLDMNLRFKKEAELARIREIKGKNEQDLEEYLEQNGYLDILNKYKENKANVNIEEEISAFFDAKRVAALEEMKQKLGSRQMSEAEAGEEGAKEQAIQKNAQNSKEEKARMAQVILFNNIITGHLVLRKKETGEEVGRNLNVLKKEVEGLQTEKVDESLFANLKIETDGAKAGNGEAFAGTEILDSILESGTKKQEETK